MNLLIEAFCKGIFSVNLQQIIVIMKKQILDFLIKENNRINENYSLLKLTPADGSRIVDAVAGQFVQVEIPDSKTTFLRRPISINYIDRNDDTLWLLIRKAGKGTEALVFMEEGRRLNLVLPLGNGFSRPSKKEARILLAGGGVGVAPMYYLGTELYKEGYDVEFLLGARRDADLLELDLFSQVGKVHCSTEDGSAGEKGLITHNSALSRAWDYIFCCGPMPMMKAIARYAAKNNIECEVSLENRMACGVGACLCCVEDTSDSGNVCVCTEGPVFNIKRLKWEI